MSSTQLLEPVVHDLSREPDTQWRLNVSTFQQSPLASFRNYQYCGFYRAQSSKSRHVVLGRRQITPGSSWEFLEFDDYEQTADDGHNTISIGICHGDGTIHLSFDHHSNDLKYRISESGLANEPGKFEWKKSLFSGVLNRLEKESHSPALPGLQLVTYPRFVNVRDGLLFECRLGRAGAGSDVLYSYDPLKQRFNLIGTYLIGIKSNPYPNGLNYDHHHRRLHVSWTNRHFIDYEGADDPISQAHAVHVGPNGPENNENLCYAFSQDDGQTWHPAASTNTTDAPGSREIVGTDPLAVAVSVPRDSGIMNQEAQGIDTKGGFHVLNRDTCDGGVDHWKHFHLTSDGRWITTILPFIKPKRYGARGKVVYCQAIDALYFLLPTEDNGKDDGLSILRVRRGEDGLFSSGHEVVWFGKDIFGEVQVDELAVEESGILYIFANRIICGENRVVILEFSLGDLNRSPSIQ